MIERIQIVEAADGLLANEDLRDRATAGGFHEPLALVGIIADIDFFEGNAALFQKSFGANAVWANESGVDDDGSSHGEGATIATKPPFARAAY